MKRKIIRFSIGLLALIIIGILVLLMRSSIPSDSSLIQKFSFDNSQTELGYDLILDHQIRYIRVTSDSTLVLPLLVMVHGAPGGITAFENYAKDSALRANFNLLIYERPGYGINDAVPEESIEIQSRILLKLIDNQTDSSKGVAFLSHSYGGPIATLASIGFDGDCLGHVMVAPVMDDKSEPIFWYSSMPNRVIVKDLISQEFYTASVEKMTHRNALKEVTNQWHKVFCRTVHFHGLEDWLAPPENIAFVQKYIPEEALETVTYPQKSHFILWSEESFQDIRDTLLTL